MGSFRPRVAWLTAIWVGLLSLPLAGVTWYFADSSLSAVASTRAERAGLASIADVWLLEGDVADSLISGQCGTPDALASQKLRRDVQRVAPEVPGVSRAWQAAVRGTPGGGAGLPGALSRGFRTVSDSSGLTYEAEMAGIDLGDAAAYRLPSAVERLLKVRAATCAAGEHARRADRLRIEHDEAQAQLILADAFDDESDAINMLARDRRPAGHLAEQYDEARRQVHRADSAVAAYQRVETPITTHESEAALSDEIASLRALAHASIVPLAAMLAQRSEDEERQAVLAFLPLFAGLLGAVAGIRLTLRAASAARALEFERDRAAHHEHQAMHDPLTGLFNRRAFFATVNAAVMREGRSGAICLVDVDRFKSINDGFGHQIGDEVLLHVASILRRAARSSDCVARLGGDEFALFLLGNSDPAGIERVLERITSEATQPLLLRGALVSYSVSAGGAVVTGHREDDVDRAMTLADAALYRAKAAPHESFAFESA